MGKWSLANVRMRVCESRLSSPSSLQVNTNITQSGHQLQAALDDASKGGRKAEAVTWRRRTHRYLDALFRLDPATAADFHHYQARPARPPTLTARKRVQQ